MSVAKLVSVILLYLIIQNTSCQTYEEVEMLRKRMLANYTRSLRPIKIQNQTMEVFLGAALGHVADFDAVNGILTTMVLLQMSWKDISLTWDPTEYGGAFYIYLSVKDVWIPNVILVNGAEDFNYMDVDVEAFQVLATSDGVMYMVYAGYLKTLCIPNVKYFPFDNNECPIMLGLHGYYSNEHAKLIPSDIHNISIIYTNPQWDVEEGILSEKELTQMKYLEKMVKLKRRPTFLLVNLFIPMIFLVVMNFFVFVLPVDSGEKASYSMTILLSFTVFVTAIMNELPQVSTDLPIVSYIILLQLFINMFVCVCTIFSIHYYHKSDKLPVGSVHQLLVRITKPSFGKTFVNKINIKKTELNGFEEGEQNFKLDAEEIGQSRQIRNLTITWRDVSEAVEKINSFTLLLLSIIEIALIVYIVV